MKVRQGLLDLVLNHFTDTMGPLLEQNQDIASYNAVFVNTKPPSFVPCAGGGGGGGRRRESLVHTVRVCTKLSW